MSRCFHPHSHANSCLLQIAVELLCFSLTVLESPLTKLPRLRVHERNLLNARVVITTYNQHIGSFLPSLGLVGTTISVANRDYHYQSQNAPKEQYSWYGLFVLTSVLRTNLGRAAHRRSSRYTSLAAL